MTAKKKLTQKRRHEIILQMLEKKEFISIDELVAHFEVAPQTIRRDLNQLADEAKIQRHHGGAGKETNTVNLNYQDRKIMNLEAKERIASAIAQSIPDGASIFINIGTTTELVAKALLKHNNLMVVTNNIHVASILSYKEDFTVIIASGEVRARDGGIVGETTIDFINQFHTDYAVIGISGINDDGYLLDFDFREVKVAQAIIKNAENVILAADSSKFGRNAVVKLGSVSQVDHMYTDIEPPENVKKLIVKSDVKLHIV
ncbi:glycerol-3-phosphate regulon repressor [Catenovulum agarivorans DS-2]|uniref:Glycerol-3-phosphate regulon repressor n=1 Tax=Catenovulum agarivorans DS-2 TaxID=1328313 RepID=W7QBK8_9ALTE|nr:DeoR/GlpR family transcriptional regulator [Catenovulum agarivorans]EWH10204.1 glycerol-3-phosphate regulon repressor [Catenovulum agarivorans DS-2]